MKLKQDAYREYCDALLILCPSPSPPLCNTCTRATTGKSCQRAFELKIGTPENAPRAAHKLEALLKEREGSGEEKHVQDLEISVPKLESRKSYGTFGEQKPKDRNGKSGDVIPAIHLVSKYRDSANCMLIESSWRATKRLSLNFPCGCALR